MSLTKQGVVFRDTTIVSATIDRLVHHAVIMNIKGKFYQAENSIQGNFNEGKNN